MRHRGFTLVEVLIASVIVFSAISLSFIAYKNSTKAIESAESTALLLRPVPLLLDQIETKLRNVPKQEYRLSGFLLGVYYEWEATPASSHSPPARFDPDKAEFVRYPERFIMYRVTLKVRLAQKERVFVYRKLGWTSAEQNSEGRSQNG